MHRYAVSSLMDMAYWMSVSDFFIFLYLSSRMRLLWIRRIDLVPSWSLVKYRHKYTVSSLMDTVYRMSEQLIHFMGFTCSNNILHVHPTKTAQVLLKNNKLSSLLLRAILQQARLTHMVVSSKLRESSSSQAMDQDQNPSGSIPDDKISQELVEEMSGEIDEAKLQKANYLKNDIVWESRKERLTLPTSKKKAPVVHSFQRDAKAPPLTLMNQDLSILSMGT
ncbi:hypothetical protein Tco_1417864 [Tanacetum coccineum]